MNTCFSPTFCRLRKDGKGGKENKKFVGHLKLIELLNEEGAGWSPPKREAITGLATYRSNQGSRLQKPAAISRRSAAWAPRCQGP